MMFRYDVNKMRRMFFCMALMGKGLEDHSGRLATRLYEGLGKKGVLQ